MEQEASNVETCSEVERVGKKIFTLKTNRARHKKKFVCSNGWCNPFTKNVIVIVNTL